ncbi:MAG TPA: DUF3857 domain-containing protein [Chitinophagales bacterium]|nr:DUF3857 domain-containing protein [Chitinophagales bacterium]
MMLQLISRLLIIVCALAIYPAYGNNYSISNIADSLKKNANAVVRMNVAVLRLKDTHYATYTEDKVISILNPAAESEATITIYYDEDERLVSFKAWVLDADGNVIKQVSKQDGIDVSACDDEEITKTRVKYWNLNQLNTPYTIHYTYQKEFSSTCFLPKWQPARTEKVAIESARFSLITEKATANYTSANVVQTSNLSGSYNWEVNNFPALKETDYSTNVFQKLPWVAVMAHNFTLYNVSGSSSTKEALGKFVQQLIAGSNELEGLNEPELEKIVASGADKKSMVSQLYKYVQRNYRYMSIQLGIGGWQPQKASVTMKKKYGDCKALVVLMQALLKKVNIDSYYTLINTNDNRIELKENFLHTFFNHVILCVPIGNDTIWLECTSPNAPPGYLGSFTENRNGLLISETGAQIVKTPAYTETFNTNRAASEIKTGDDNTHSITSRCTVTGELQERLRYALASKDEKRIEPSIFNIIHSANTKISSYKIVEIRGDIPSITIDLQLSNQGVVRKTASRLFIRTDMFKPINSLTMDGGQAYTDVQIQTGLTQSDTLIYAISAGYVPENFTSGEKRDISSPFGYASIELAYNAGNGSMKIVRTFCLKEGVYPALQFKQFSDFTIKAIKLYCPELVLKKPE